MKTKLFTIVALLGLTASMGWAQRVRVVHASPDAPAVDIYVDGQKAFQDLPFGSATDYAEVERDQHEFSVNIAGTDTMVLRTFAFIDGRDYTILAIGFAGGGTPALAVLPLADDYVPPAEGKAAVRVVHAAPSAPAVDVYWTSPFAALGEPVLSSVPFGVASGYLTVPASMQGPGKLYQARVTVAGTETVAIDSGRILLPSQAVRTYIALDDPGSEGFQIIELLDRN